MRPITRAALFAAQEKLILSRPTYLEQLAHKD